MQGYRTTTDNRGRSQVAGRPQSHLVLGTPVDSSVTSSRARVAALTRHRPADDPEIEQARQALIRDRDTDRARRALGRLKPEDRAQLLANEGAPARV